MKIKGIEVDFDFLDADDIERLEKEALKVQTSSENTSKEEIPYSEAIRKECMIINEFLDNVFGEGISQQIFNGKMNLNEHIKVFEDIMREKLAQTKQLQNIYDRYMPRGSK